MKILILCLVIALSSACSIRSTSSESEQQTNVTTHWKTGVIKDKFNQPTDKKYIYTFIENDNHNNAQIRISGNELFIVLSRHSIPYKIPSDGFMNISVKSDSIEMYIETHIHRGIIHDHNKELFDLIKSNDITYLNIDISKVNKYSNDVFVLEIHRSNLLDLLSQVDSQ